MAGRERRSNVAAKVRGNVFVARLVAMIAAAPAFVAAIALAGLALAATGIVGDSQPSFVGFLICLVLALLVGTVADWTFRGVRGWLTKQRVQVIWLRRFQAERGQAFKPSRIIDRLNRDGISPLTLQDRDVQLSFEQRRNRLAPLFWLLFIPLAIAVGFAAHYALTHLNELNILQTDQPERPPARSVEEFVQALVSAMVTAFVQVIVAAIVVIAAAVGALLAGFFVVFIAAIASGPFGRVLFSGREDFKRLPRLLRRIHAGKGPRGSLLVRVSDAHWRQAVTDSLKVVDAAIIDLTDVTEQIAWEVGEAVKACGRDGLVLICRAGGTAGGVNELTPTARGVLGGALGGEVPPVIFYPADKQSGRRFARLLRDAVYAAHDKRVDAFNS